MIRYLCADLSFKAHFWLIRRIITSNWLIKIQVIIIILPFAVSQVVSFVLLTHTHGPTVRLIYASEENKKDQRILIEYQLWENSFRRTIETLCNTNSEMFFSAHRECAHTAYVIPNVRMIAPYEFDLVIAVAMQYQQLKTFS